MFLWVEVYVQVIYEATVRPETHAQVRGPAPHDLGMRLLASHTP